MHCQIVIIRIIQTPDYSGLVFVIMTAHCPLRFLYHPSIKASPARSYKELRAASLSMTHLSVQCDKLACSISDGLLQWI